MFQTPLYVEKYWSLFFAVGLFSCYFLLGIDSVKSADTVQKFLLLSSRDIFVALIIANLFSRLMFKIKLPSLIENINTFLIMPVSLIACIALPIIDYFTYTNFSYSRLFINFQQMSFIALGSVMVSILNSDMTWLKKNIKLLIFLSAPLIIFSLFIIRLWPNDVFMRLVKEDNLIENSQFLVLLSAGFAALFTASKMLSKNKAISLLYLIGGLGLLFVAGDEVSWGQRIFDITPASFFSSNVQQETNIHNLSAFNNLNGVFYILIGLYGSVSWMFLNFLKNKNFWQYFSPLWFLSPFFFAGFIYNFLAVVLMFNSFGEWSEVAELMLYTGTLLFFVLQATYPPAVRKIKHRRSAVKT